MSKYKLTFQFQLNIEIGDKDILEVIRDIERSYSENCIGEKTTVIEFIKME